MCPGMWLIKIVGTLYYNVKQINKKIFPTCFWNQISAQNIMSKFSRIIPLKAQHKKA